MKSNDLYNSIQTLIDFGHVSTKSKSALATFIEWAEGDGWEQCISAWEAVGEPVVYHWPEFVRQFANDYSVQECEGLALDEITDELRVEHLNSRLVDISEDPSSEMVWTCHPLKVGAADREPAIFLILSQLEGYSQKLKLVGITTPSCDTTTKLLELGYSPVDRQVSAGNVLKAWA